MNVYIGNLPGEATLVQLQGLIGDFGLHADFHCCKGRDPQANHYHFLLARTGTRRQGLELIARINGYLFQGKQVVAREFVQRTRTVTWSGEERRINPAQLNRIPLNGQPAD